MKLIFILAFVILHFSKGNLLITSPKELRDKLNKANKNEQKEKNEIPSKTAVFGEIPFGKTITGYIFLPYPLMGYGNDWCDSGTYKQNIKIDLDSLSFSPIMLVGEGGCSLSQKAKNVQNAKGAAMIVASRLNSYLEDQNYDDQEGRLVTIPTKIISKTSGNILFDWFENNNAATVLVSMNFNDMDLGDRIEFKMFFRSDQIKALHFFKEFEHFHKELGGKLVFQPVYKYTECQFCPAENSLNETADTCFFDGKYCGGINNDLNITNSRLVLLENLRQKCIFEEENIEIYWKYMIKFSDVCADINMPTFNKKCSYQVMKLAKVNTKKNELCMNKAIGIETSIEGENYNTLIKEDFDLFESSQIHRFPTITLNNVKYKDEWLAQSVFKKICEQYLSNQPVCAPKKPNEEINLRPSNDNSLSISTLILLTLIIFFSMLLILYCYRRAVNRTIEESIEERIFKQTQDSVGNYSKMDRNNILTTS